MRLLLDTQIAVWAIADDPQLSGTARALILDASNEVFVSAASVSEIAVSHASARGRPDDMPISGAQALCAFAAAGYAMLPISPAHAAAIEQLPRRHDDPFDRMLLAQAITEPLRLLTSDARVLAYGRETIRA
jgi:PIN domain nuclease of toxin-antitoxin system